MQTFEDWFEGAFGSLRKKSRSEVEKEIYKVCKDASGVAWSKAVDQCKADHIVILQQYVEDLRLGNARIAQLEKELELEKRERALERGEMELRLNQICQTAGIH